MPNWKKLIVSGSDASLNSLNVTNNVTAQSFTGSLFGTSSFANTASFVTTLNQTVLITGSLGVGVTSLGSTENTLVLGPAPAGGSGEGGQILLQAQGGTYTSASMLDNYQNKFRLLRGTNAGSDGYKLQVDLQTGQLQLPNYNSTSAFTGTTLVGLVGFDSSGNLLTTQTSSAALSGGSTNYVARWASSATLTTGSIFDSGSNVGIGTTSPESISSTTTLTINGSTGGGAVSFQVGGVRTGLVNGNDNYLTVQSYASRPLSLGYNGTNTIVVNTSNNVGIGTTSPSQKLHVEGSAKVRDAIYLGGNTDVISASSISGFMTIGSNQPIRFTDAGSTEFLRITTGGNVGIGTTSPSYKLDVVGATNTAGLYSRGANIGFESQIAALGTNGAYQAGYYLGATNTVYAARLGMDVNSGDVYLGIGNTGSLSTVTYFKANGNVGIGTTSPSTKLDVIGNSYISGSLSVKTTSTAGTGLTVGGSTVLLSFAEIQQGNSLYLYSSGNTYYSTIRQDSQNLIFTPDTNVGIGTTSPTAKLEVNGNVKATSFTGSLSGSATNAVSASYALVATSASYAVSSSYALTATTASYALTASFINPLNQNLIVTGSVIATGGITASNALINGNLTVIGTASFSYTTASIVNVGASTITLNTDNPAVRFGGITVVDSGSFGTSSTGSLLWDSQNNRWVYSNPSGSTYDGGLLISGPRNTSGLGNEEGTTLNALMKGQGGDHITSSGVFEVSGSVGIGTSSPVYTLVVKQPSNSTSTGLQIAQSDSASDGMVLQFISSEARIKNRTTGALTLGTNDTERFRITAGGNVGIGTTSPSSILDTEVSSGATSGFRFKGWSDASTPYLLSLGTQTYQDIFQIKSVNGLVTMGIVGAVGANPDLAFQTNTTERMRITTAGNVGIGTTSPTEKLHVVGKIRLEDTYFQSNNPASFPNFAIGTSNFTSTVTGYGNIGFGYEALSLLTSGRYNVAAGYTALANVTTGQANVALGPFALRQTTTGTYNIGIGDDALTNNINGSYNIGFGSSALENNINGEENIGIGEGAIQASKHGSYNIAMGYYALNYLTNTTSSYNIGIGYLSGGNLAGGIHNTYLGNNLHVVSTGSYNVFIGGNIAVNALGFSSATKSVVIADNSGSVKIFADSTGSVGIGTVTPSAKLEVSGNVKATSFSGSFSGSVSAPGSTTQIVYNDNGILAATSSLVYSGSNVGIGISAPTERLHIVGSTSGNQFARITATDSDSSAAWVAQNDSGDNVVYRVFSSGVIGTQMSNALSRSASLLANLGGSGVFLLGTFSNTNFVLGTNNTERMRITNSGNVGIGTTSPATKLQVNGTFASNALWTDTSSIAYWGNYSTAYGALTWDTGYAMVFSTGGNALRFGTNGTSTRMTIDTSGNVGIGTTSPLRALHVVGGVGTAQIQSTGTSSHIYFGDTNSSVIDNQGMGSVGDNLWFSTGGFERMRITSGGNVGIGTTNPQDKLTVKGPTGYNLNLGTLGGYSGIYVYNDASSAYKELRIDAAPLILQSYSGGNVGIGTTSPSYKLEVVGAVSASTYYGDGSNLTNIGSGSVSAAGSDGQIQYNNSGLFGGASRLYYNDSTNRVGIGTSSPGYDLDVSGSARVQDRLRVGVVNSGNGVIHQSSDATINPSGATTVWTVPGTAGICAFIEYYLLNSTTGTSQRAGNIVTTWNAAGTPQITHTETSTPDVGSTSPVTFTTALTLGGDPQLIATNTSGNTWYMVMNYRYF